jgi:hypothetical protein
MPAGDYVMIRLGPDYLAHVALKWVAATIAAVDAWAETRRLVLEMDAAGESLTACPPALRVVVWRGLTDRANLGATLGQLLLTVDRPDFPFDLTALTIDGDVVDGITRLAALFEGVALWDAEPILGAVHDLALTRSVLEELQRRIHVGFPELVAGA